MEAAVFAVLPLAVQGPQDSTAGECSSFTPALQMSRASGDMQRLMLIRYAVHKASL